MEVKSREGRKGRSKIKTSHNQAETYISFCQE